MWGRPPSAVQPGKARQLRVVTLKRVPQPCPCLLCRDRMGFLIFFDRSPQKFLLQVEPPSIISSAFFALSRIKSPTSIRSWPSLSLSLSPDFDGYSCKCAGCRAALDRTAGAAVPTQAQLILRHRLLATARSDPIALIHGSPEFLPLLRTHLSAAVSEAAPAVPAWAVMPQSPE